MKLTKTKLKQIIKEELRAVLQEGVVETEGLHTWTEDYKDVTVTLDGGPLSVVKIFDDLNDEQDGEWEGWKNNMPQEEWARFMSDHVRSAVEDWAIMFGHRYDASHDD